MLVWLDRAKISTTETTIQTSKDTTAMAAITTIPITIRNITMGIKVVVQPVRLVETLVSLQLVSLPKNIHFFFYYQSLMHQNFLSKLMTIYKRPVQLDQITSDKLSTMKTCDFIFWFKFNKHKMFKVNYFFCIKITLL